MDPMWLARRATGNCGSGLSSCSHALPPSSPFSAADYDAILDDFVTLQFIPRGTDLRPIKPVLAKVFDQALQGGGAKGINFNDLAANLAQITFDYPFR